MTTQYDPKKSADGSNCLEVTNSQPVDSRKQNLLRVSWWIAVIILAGVISYGVFHISSQQPEVSVIVSKPDILEKFQQASFEEILKNKTLTEFAIAGAEPVFRKHCVTCHGEGGRGKKGHPVLNDKDWLWGGRLKDIYLTLQVGIRANHPDTHYAMMPSYEGVLSEEEVSAVADYVLGMHRGESMVPQDELTAKEIAELPLGAKIYREKCTICHANDGRGRQELGVPNLTDTIWLMSEGNKTSVVRQIKYPKHGVMQSWEKKLDNETLRQLTIYVHSLGGGE